MENINKSKLDEFLGIEPIETNEENSKVIKKDKSLIERVDKRIIIEDGRQLLM